MYSNDLESRSLNFPFYSLDDLVYNKGERQRARERQRERERQIEKGRQTDREKDGRTKGRRMEAALTAAPHLQGFHARLEALHGGSDGRGRLR